MPTAADLAQTILLRGRHSLATVPQLGEEVAQREQALTGRLVPLSTAEDPFVWTSQVCRSASELLQSLEWSAGLSGGLGPIPLLKARQEFFESLHTTVFSISVVVQARRVVGAFTSEDVALKPDVALPSDGAALDGFVHTYGDSWVKAVVLGGQMQGVYTLYAQSREQAKEVATAVDLLVSTGTISLGPSFSKQLKTIAKDANVNVSSRVSVSGLAQPPVITEDNMAAFASSFGTLALDNPVVLSLQTQGYEDVGELREVFQPVARNRILLSGDGLQPGLRRQWQRLRELVNQCNWVAGTYDIYGIPQDPSLASHRTKMTADCREIEALCSAYHTSPSTPLAEPVLEAFAAGSPKLQVQVRDGESMGGRGGDPFPYEDRENAVRRRRKLARVGLRAGNRVDQIRLRYHQEPTGEPDEWINESHGGGGGSDLGDMELGSGEGIARIKGLSGIPNGRVDQLELTTSDGQRRGGGGDKGNTPLDWQAAPNQVLLGFYGRSKAELDSLTAVIATFGPLAWEEMALAEDP
ncbi:MAG: jacalin-like lectin [Cyanobium sp.]